MRHLSTLKTPSAPPQSGAARPKGKLPLALVFALLITFLVSRGSTLLSMPEFSILDAWFASRPARTVSPSIVLVGVDKELLDKFQKEKDKLGRQGRLAGAGTCTCASIGRDVLGEAVHRIKGAGAKVVGLDFVFDLPCPEHDPALLRALKEPGQTILLSGTNPTPGRFNFTDLPSFLELSPPPIVASPVLYNPRGVIRGVRLIQEEGAHADEPGKLTVLQVRPPLSVAAYLAFRDQSEELPEALSSHFVRCGDVTVPVLPTEHVVLLKPLMLADTLLADKHAMLISWAGKMGTFPMYSLEALRKASPQQLVQWFKGRIVLIGSIDDRQFAPVGRPAIPARFPFIDQTNYEAMAGLEIHANAIDTLLGPHFIRPLPTAAVWLLMVVVSFLTLLSFMRLPAWKAVVVTLLELGVLVAVSAYAIRSDHWVYVFIPSLSIFFSAITGAVWGFTEVRHTAEDLAYHIEARDSATTTLVHDLKQPLAAINALAQILRMQEQSGKAPGPELIQRIQQQVQMALGDIDELLSTDPNREIPLELKSFDVTALARDLAIAQSLKSTVHEVEIRAPEEPVLVDADPRYLGRALSNLMDNAIKYWPDGGTVLVEIRREPGQAKIRVIDGGLGIAPEAQARLFNRFQRAVPAGVDIPGTGIGLFSVKRIIEAHGGAVNLISAPGEGSIFSMTLPLGRPSVEQLARGIAT